MNLKPCASPAKQFRVQDKDQQLDRTTEDMEVAMALAQETSSIENYDSDYSQDSQSSQNTTIESDDFDYQDSFIDDTDLTQEREDCLSTYLQRANILSHNLYGRKESQTRTRSNRHLNARVATMPRTRQSDRLATAEGTRERPDEHYASPPIASQRTRRRQGRRSAATVTGWSNTATRTRTIAANSLHEEHSGSAEDDEIQKPKRNKRSSQLIVSDEDESSSAEATSEIDSLDDEESSGRDSPAVVLSQSSKDKQNYVKGRTEDSSWRPDGPAARDNFFHRRLRDSASSSSRSGSGPDYSSLAKETAYDAACSVSTWSSEGMRLRSMPATDAYNPLLLKDPLTQESKSLRRRCPEKAVFGSEISNSASLMHEIDRNLPFCSRGKNNENERLGLKNWSRSTKSKSAKNNRNYDRLTKRQIPNIASKDRLLAGTEQTGGATGMRAGPSSCCAAAQGSDTENNNVFHSNKRKRTCSVLLLSSQDVNSPRPSYFYDNDNKQEIPADDLFSARPQRLRINSSRPARRLSHIAKSASNDLPGLYDSRSSVVKENSFQDHPSHFSADNIQVFASTPQRKSRFQTIALRKKRLRSPKHYFQDDKA